jgi:beta-lactamase superfamily II metal-dependent hydrolase
VLLVEIGRRKILLTGDARGDDIVAGFKDAMPDVELPMKVDILKMPHHGSDRNMTKAFLQSFPADHYVISADGTFGNPEDNTLRAIVAARGPDEDYTIHLTNAIGRLQQLLPKLSKGRAFKFAVRGAQDLSVTITLP